MPAKTRVIEAGFWIATAIGILFVIGFSKEIAHRSKPYVSSAISHVMSDGSNGSKTEPKAPLADSKIDSTSAGTSRLSWSIFDEAERENEERLLEEIRVLETRKRLRRAIPELQKRADDLKCELDGECGE